MCAVDHPNGEIAVSIGRRTSLVPVVLCALCALCAFVAFDVRADTLLLRDKRRIEGTVEEDGDDYLITTIHGKTIRVKKSDVLLYAREPRRNKLIRTYRERSFALTKGDAAGHYELGMWARAHGLKEQARSQFLKVLAADPFHEGAGRALGRVRKNGRWVRGKEPGLRIEAAPKNTRRDERGLRQKLLERFEELTVDTQADAGLKGLIAEARQRPEVFVALLKAPGLRGGANVRNAVVRAKVAYVLGEAGDRRAMEPLIEACLRDPDDRVRFAAARALPRLGEPIALRRLVDRAVDPRSGWPYRQLASIALRRYGDKEAIERLLMEVSFELAGGNARDPKNKLRAPTGGLGTDNPMMLPPGPPSGNTDERVIYPALTALKEVTKTGFDSGEKDFKTWKLWWEKNRDTFKFDIR